WGLLCGVFFFQAEAGIRDWSVPGVQTCALPIFEPVEALLRAVQGLDRLDRVGRQVDGRRLHLHHPAAGDVDRQGGEVVQVRVGGSEERRVGEGGGVEGGAWRVDEGEGSQQARSE